MNQDISSIFPQFSRLDPESARLLDESARTMAVPAGTVLFQDGAECQAYVLVLEGSVRVQKVSEGGREIVLYRVEAGQSCVLTTNCLIAREDYAAQGIAESDLDAWLRPEDMVKPRSS